MELNNKLKKLSDKLHNNEPYSVMIIGLGSVGMYLLEYLVNMSNPLLQIIVVGRDNEKLTKDVNIIRTAATIRGTLQSDIFIESNCDLDNKETIADVLKKYKPDFIVNTSRVYSGMKYGSISWHNFRAYGIWTPLAIKYIRNIMEAYNWTNSESIVINTSYSDAVIPWLKSAGYHYPDFGSGNLNHLIPRMKFYIADKFGIKNLNDIDITLATSHFHDVVISKEGHSEGVPILLNVKYQNETLPIVQDELLKSCAISMPTDHKRNMMNASSNFNILTSIIDSIRLKKKIRIHSPGVLGNIGGYPYIIDSTRQETNSYFDTEVFSFEQMLQANRQSIYLDGIEDVKDGYLIYTDELLAKVDDVMKVKMPKKIHFEDIDGIADFIIQNIIKK